MIGEAPRRPAEMTPVRAPGSIRRTSTIDTIWPGGDPELMHVAGRARDLYTPANGGEPVVRAEDAFTATLGNDRAIRAIETSPRRAATPQLVGERGGGHLRKALGELMPEELAGATPLYLLLDDISGASLVARWAWSQWVEDWRSLRDREGSGEQLAQPTTAREGVCIGFAPGNTALTQPPGTGLTGGAPVPDLRNPADRQGWHEFADQAGAVGMRRARRIDVALAGDAIRIDSHFQDSASHRDGGRVGLHEYLLSAAADRAGGRITAIAADPRILPFPECPQATLGLQRLVGTKLSDLRQTVLGAFRGVHGCTHLNDALRALAEVPALAGYLEETGG